ncbi:MAG: DUF1501 domain-containing protein [Pirellulales bacterium]|nr:DUF1501 domain-containing protein [Pirellulales bacterium]
MRNLICSEAQSALSLSRRAFLQVGAIGSAGLTLADVLRADARAAASGAASARKSVIILWLRGGPSQHDMWDPKPEAPSEIRGEFAPIATAVPGVQVCELLPQCARIMHKWSLIRSLHHRPEDGDVGHSNGDQICFTGYASGPNPDINIMPSCGSIVARQQQRLDPSLPAYVVIPKVAPGMGAAYLGAACNPFETVADPAIDSPFRVRDFALAEGLTSARVQQRGMLRSALDRMRPIGATAETDKFHAQALDIVAGGAASAAFDLESEPQHVRERYGMMPTFDPGDPMRCGSKNWAQRMLLARRLIEAGVRIVTVEMRWWDFHKQGFDSQRRGFLPRFDQAYSALIEDLEQRGLLESTLVVAWGEMGRTPRVNKDAGRDHWPQVFSAALAGGGVQGGRVIGASDRTGSIPKDNPKLPHDVLATIYQHLGVDTRAQYTDTSGRPHVVLPQGERVAELFS